MTRTRVSMHRVLPVAPVASFASYVGSGGGSGMDAARRLGSAGVVEHLVAAGLRGRGGAGFPTGRKWDAVCAYESPSVPTTVVVNAAEGEPGSFKDRVLLRANPYAVLEGAVIATHTVGADRLVVALKRSFARERVAVEHACAELRAANWLDGIEVIVYAGPSEYLYGEETALLEAIDGRGPFPRLQPPFRHGVEEVSRDGGAAARVVMADAGGTTIAPPTLVNNVETMANVPDILAHGPSWFREFGTAASPGTIVCTITGCTRHPGVGEVPMGTPLRDVIDEIGGGARPGRRVVAAMSGVANPVVPEELLDTPLTYEAMQEIGSGLGAAGFIVFDDTTDFAAVAQGVARFLAVESCGQCTPCKQDGLALCELLDRVRRSDASDADLRAIDDHLQTITDGARCFLAHQHQRVVGSLMTRFADDFHRHVERGHGSAETVLIAPIVDMTPHDVALDESQQEKQPDWTYGAIDSGKTPVDRMHGTAGLRGEDTAVPPIPAPEPPTAPEPAPEPRPASTEHQRGRTVHGVPADALDPDDPEASLYTSEPLETDEGTIVIQQQNVSGDNMEGGGEWPDPDTEPQPPAPGSD